MILTIYGERHSFTVGDNGDGYIFIGVDDDEEAYTLTKTDASALMEVLKLILYKQ